MGYFDISASTANASTLNASTANASLLRKGSSDEIDLARSAVELGLCRRVSGALLKNNKKRRYVPVGVVVLNLTINIYDSELLTQARLAISGLTWNSYFSLDSYITNVGYGLHYLSDLSLANLCAEEKIRNY